MSSKVYSIKYTDNAALPKARPPIVIPGGKLYCVQIPFLTEGYITRLIIKQTSGTAVAADIELLDSKVPYPPGISPANTAPADDIELYRIVDKQTVVSGSALKVIHEEYGFPYHNQDGTFSDNQRYIYLVIIPTGAVGSSTWDIAITGHDEVG